MNNAAIRYYSVNLRIVAAMRVILRKLVIEEFWNSCEEEEDKVKSLRWLIHLRIIARKFANNYPIQRFISVNFIRVYSRIWWYDNATYFCRRSNCCRWDQLVDDHPLCHIFLFLFFSRTYVPMNDELIDRICEHWWFSIYQNPRLIIMKRSLFAVDKVLSTSFLFFKYPRNVFPRNIIDCYTSSIGCSILNLNWSKSKPKFLRIIFIDFAQKSNFFP